MNRAVLRVVLGAILAIVAALAGGPAYSAPASPAPAADPVRIMPLGDSITGSPGCWRAVLWNRLQDNGFTDIDFVGTLPPQGCGVSYDGDNEGHGGYLVTNVAEQNQLPGWLAATSPDVVLMHFGTNDVWSNRSTEQILAAYTTLVTQMRADNPAMKVIVAQLIPMNPPSCAECAARVVDLNAAIPGWASGISTAQSPVSVVDQWTGFDTATDTYDGVHPNDSGNQKMSDAWYPALAAALGGSSTPADPTGLRVNGTQVVEANGSPFVMRGVSHAHVWFPNETDSFAGIKSLGANTVRVVLGSGQRWGPSTDVANVVSLCKQNRLICVLEVHDTTGYGEDSAAATLDQAASYWISQSDALVGQEDYVVINLGNEPFGNDADVSATWATATSNAINRLRDNGFDHLIMADAPMWGQDWAGIMRDDAASVEAADPDHNTVFSIHMYGVYDTAAEINAYLDAFANNGLPLVIGEFGFNHSDGDPDEDTIMAQAQARGVGYIGWSWCGNSGGVEYLDMVTDFDPNNLTSWGERFFNGANGVRETSKEATIYG